MFSLCAVVLSCVLTAEPVEVEGENVSIGLRLILAPIPVQDLRTEKVRPTVPYLQCVLTVKNKGSEDIAFQGWGSSPTAAAVLSDDVGNRYRLADLGATSLFPGKIKSASIAPGKAVVECLPFQVPSGSASAYTLTLKGRNVGKERDLVIRFTRAQIAEPMKAMKNEPRPAGPKTAATGAPEATPWRVWTSADGQFTVEARFLRSGPGTVVLQRRDGRQIEVAEEKLAREDIQWIESQRRKASP